jgi:predicted ATPase/class 3 adenylate cyclase/DNA-binding winged helix-turn-helix (wHTH) protein
MTAPPAAPASSARQRLLAIVAADAVGYSRRMAEDDHGTLAALEAARAVFRSVVQAHDGRIVDTAGDSVLAAFERAAGAVDAALVIQHRLQALPALPFRIGVHLGDVIEKADGTLYGDGVNVAARLQALAEPGGVLLSQVVQSTVASRIAAEFDDLGERTMKNLPQPLRVWRVRRPGSAADVLRFGPGQRFELQRRERRLLVDGRPAALGGRAFDVLLALAARPGRPVGRNELIEAAWPGLVVEENNLSVQVSNLRKLLGGDIIATIPGRGYRFTASPEAVTPAPAATAAPPAAAMAPRIAAPALIGRDADLERAGQALEQAACVTLIGVAGVGKTSLARGVAARWPAGAVWVDLAPLTDGAQLPLSLARALDHTLAAENEVAELAQALGARLLVLDNAEHLVGGVAAFACALLAASAALRLLVTSQVALALPAERVHRIEPLPLPGDGDTLDDPHGGAIALFVERVQAADHRFRPAPAALPLLREICRQLDGLPLALEMAAVRVPALGLKGVRDALQQRFSLLTAGWRAGPARHRTLHTALDWSYSLLGAEEQRLLRVCGVFAGGFTLELVVDVAGGAADRWAVIDALTQLVERSLVATDDSDPPRYRLLETVRAYALEQLAAAGEEAAARQRHALALRTLFEAGVAAPAVRPIALAEHDNAREAVAWALHAHPELALPLAVAIGRTSTFVTWRRAAGAWVESCLPVVDDARVSAADRAAWWNERTRHHVMTRHPQAHAIARRALEMQLSEGDEMGRFDAMAGVVRSSPERDPALPALCRELEALAARHPEWPPIAALKLAGALGLAARLMGDNEGQLRHRLREHALALSGGWTMLAEVAETNIVAALQNLGRYDEALVRARAMVACIGGQETLNAAYAWYNLVGALIGLRRWNEARAIWPRASALLARFELPLLSDQAALMAAREQRPRAAALLIGYTRAAYEAAESDYEPEVHERLAEAEAVARAALDEGEFTRRVGAGHALDGAAADRLLLADGDAD